jgi:hypothetical protein
MEYSETASVIFLVTGLHLVTGGTAFPDVCVKLGREVCVLQ